MDIPPESFVLNFVSRAVNKEDIQIVQGNIIFDERSQNQYFPEPDNEPIFEECIGINPDKEVVLFENYDPMKEAPNLYRLACGLSCLDNEGVQVFNGEKILEFCRQWGMFGFGSDGVIKGKGGLVDLDPFRRIHKEITYLTDCIHLFDLLRKKDDKWGPDSWPAKSNGCIEWKKKPHKSVFAKSIYRSYEIFYPHLDNDNLSEFVEWEDDRSAIKYALLNEINKRLSDHTKSVLLYIQNKRLPKHKWKVGTYVLPKSLVGALWYQLALEVEGVRAAYKCKNCNESFVSLTKPRGINPQFCNTSCRVAHHRKMKKSAKV